MKLLRSFGLVVAALFVTWTAQAQEADWAAEVVKVKGGKAVINLTDKSIKEGARLWAAAPKTEASQDTSGLRPRQHGLAWNWRNTEIKFDSSGSFDFTRMEFSYLYNMGYYEVGGFYNNDKYDIGGSDFSMPDYGLAGRLNLMPNEPGQDMLPYLTLELHIKSLKAGGESESGSGFGFRFGFQWFPFSEIFALDLSFKTNSVDLEVSGQKVTLKENGLGIGWAIYF